LHALQDRLQADPALLAQLDNTELGFAERKARLDSLLPSDAGAEVKNFLYVLLREGHVAVLGEVIADLTRLATRGPEARVAHIVTVLPLTPDEKEAFRRQVHARFGKDVDLDFRVDSSILGGAILQVGDRVIDGSIAGKLNALHERLVGPR
jgi:ATP synthase F1 delta subunit